MAERELRIRATMDASGAVKGSKQTTNAVKKVKGQTDQTSKSVGRFSDVLSNASTGVAAFEGPLGKTAGRMSTFATITRRAETVLDSKIKALGRFKVALAATGIGAVVVALGTLIQAFRSTQEGSDRLNRMLIPLKSVLEGLWGVIQNVAIALADRLVEAFQNPQQAIRDFGNLIFTQIQNRISGVIESFGALGRGLSRLIRGDFAGAKEAANDYAESLAKIATGADDTLSRMKAFGEGIAEASRESFEAGKQIQSLNEQIRQLKIDQEVPLARLNREYRELINVARDTNRNEEERLQAINRAIEARKQITAQETQLLDLEIERMRVQQSLNDTSDEELLQLQKLIGRREELVARQEQELTRALSVQRSVQNEIQNTAAQQREAEAARIQALEEQAQAYLDTLLTEEELAQRRYEKELGMVRELLNNEIITRQEFLAIRKQLEDDFINQELETEQARVGSIMALEQQLATAKLAFRQAVNDEERQFHAEEMERIRQRLSEISGTEQAATAARVEGYQEAGAGAIRYGQDAKSTVNGVIDALIAEAVAAQIRNIISTVPFPFNLVLAAGAAVGVTKLRNQIPEFLEGGQVPGAIGSSGMTSPGRKLISINENSRPEYIVNAESTRRSLPLLEAINSDPGYAQLLMSGMQSAFLDGGRVGRRTSGSDLPMASTGGDSMVGVLQRLNHILDGGIVARTELTELDDAQARYNLKQRALGNA